MSKTIRWGILSTGQIAGDFAQALRFVPDAELLAVGSRTLDKARQFAQKHNAPRAYGSYEELAADKDIDIIYIGTPHTLHMDDTLLSLRHGKAVLCEKPFSISAAQSQRMVDEARQRGLLLMEAMWTRFTPVMCKVRELLAEGTVGPVRSLLADFSFRKAFDPAGRLFNPVLGGGALLDVGVYVISFAHMVLGEPKDVCGLMMPTPNGVDYQTGITLGYPGAIASLHCGMSAMTPMEATIAGENGRIRISSPWFKAKKFSIRRGDKQEDFDLSYESNGLQFQAIEAQRCLREGLVESPIMPHADTIAVGRTMDRLRKQWDLRYPGE